MQFSNRSDTSLPDDDFAKIIIFHVILHLLNIPLIITYYFLILYTNSNYVPHAVQMESCFLVENNDNGSKISL